LDIGVYVAAAFVRFVAIFRCSKVKDKAQDFHKQAILGPLSLKGVSPCRSIVAISSLWWQQDAE
jgi:hypothetical protein